MCEYCGCQDIPAIADLTAEHDGIRTVARDAQRAAAAGDHPAAVETAGRLRALLEPHNRIEELGLFPAMAGEFAEHTDRLVAEHRNLEEALGELTSGQPATPGWEQRLSAALHDLFEHILREQDGLFPATLSVLTPERWDTLDEVRAAVTSRASTTAAG
jgi:hemerythrin-like domain-containing protein